MPNTEDKKLNVSSSELVELIKAVMTETRKPTELEQLQINEHKEKIEAKKRDIEMAQQTRKQGAADAQRVRETAIANQKRCLHKSGKPVPHAHTVYVSDQLGGYILCQKCFAVIRPENTRSFYGEDYAGTIIFNSALFDQLFQDTNESGVYA